MFNTQSSNDGLSTNPRSGDNTVRPLLNATYGFSSDEELRSIVYTEGYFYGAGWTYSVGAGLMDFLLMEWDNNGNVDWYQTFGTAGYDKAEDTWANGTDLYTVGYSNGYSDGDYDVLIIKWRTDGYVEWDTYWGGNGSDYGNAIIGLNNSIYILGTSDSATPGNVNLILLKYSLNGTFIWSTSWGGDGLENAGDLWTDGTYIYALGSSASYEANGTDYVLLKWDQQGNLLWYKMWGGDEGDEGYALYGNSTGIMAVGYTASYAVGTGAGPIGVVFWDFNGNIQWWTSCGDDGDDARDVIMAGDYVYISGYTDDSNGYDDVFLLKLDRDMNRIWKATWGGSSNDRSFGMAWDGGNIAALIGSSNSYDTQSMDTLIVYYEMDQRPIADFDYPQYDVRVYEEIHFNFTGYVSELPAQYLWDFGDNQSASYITDPDHMYNESGVYDVKLTVIDADGDNSTIVHQVRIIDEESEQSSETSSDGESEPTQDNSTDTDSESSSYSSSTPTNETDTSQSDNSSLTGSDNEIGGIDSYPLSVMVYGTAAAILTIWTGIRRRIHRIDYGI